MILADSSDYEKHLSSQSGVEIATADESVEEDES